MKTGLEPPFSVPEDRPLHPIASSSAWTDTVWRFDFRTPGRRPNDFQIRWDWRVPGGRFDQPEWTTWRETVRTFIWSLLADPPEQGRVLRFASVKIKFQCMRVLVKWMVDHGHPALSDLDQDAQRQFIHDMSKRKGRVGNLELKPRTLKEYQETVRALYLQGLKYLQLAIDEPPVSDRISIPRRHRSKLSRPPDEIAVPLLLQALRLVGEPADDVIALRSRAQAAFDAALHEGRSKWLTHQAALRAVSDFTFATLPGEDDPWYPHPITGTRQISYLVDRIYDACFVLISYLVGPRASEILGLEAGCLERERSIDGTLEFLFIKGRIYKTAAVATGDPHRWIAPEIIERVINVLEILSARLRARFGKPHLWLTTRGAGMEGSDGIIDILSSNSVIRRLNDKLAEFVDLPTFQGKQWHLTTHQGRKWFAWSVAKVDRTGLHALKAHFGHRSVIMTDQGYAGIDHEMSELIDEATQEEMARGYAEILTAERLAGPAAPESSRSCGSEANWSEMSWNTHVHD